MSLRARVAAMVATPGKGWIVWVALVWGLMPMLRLEAARVVAYDGVILAAAGYLVLDILVGSRFRASRGAGRRWRLTGDARVYGWYLILIFAGLISGMNTVSLVPWGIELATFVYLLIMLLVLDAVGSLNLERFITIGVYVFAGISIVTGVASILSLAGVHRFEMFMARQGTGYGDKFTGFARSPNQWASYFLSFFPFLIGISFRVKGWRRWFLVAAALLGAFTIPASGSRTGVVLLLLEGGGMVALFLVLARHISVTRRVLLVAAVAAGTMLTYALVFTTLDKFWVVRRALSGFDYVSGEQSIGTDWRARNWRWALQEIEKHPFIGMGLGTFHLFYDRHEVHSSYLSLWAEAGPMAVLAYIGLQISLLVHSVRALVSAWRWRLDTTLLAAVVVALLGQTVMGFTHTLTRARNVAVTYWLVFAYSQYMLVQVQGLVAQQQRRNAEHRAALAAGRLGRLAERDHRAS